MPEKLGTETDAVSNKTSRHSHEVSSPSNSQARDACVKQKIDERFFEAAVRREAIQQFDQSLFDWQKDHVADTSELESCQQPRDGDTLEAICRQYGHNVPSEASPLERWAVLSVADAEFPLHAKICMERVGLSAGSLESIETRARAAAEITRGLQLGFKSR